MKTLGGQNTIDGIGKQQMQIPSPKKKIFKGTLAKQMHEINQENEFDPNPKGKKKKK
jgi:hypothetical protein